MIVGKIDRGNGLPSAVLQNGSSCRMNFAENYGGPAQRSYNTQRDAMRVVEQLAVNDTWLASGALNKGVRHPHSTLLQSVVCNSL